MSLVTIEKIEKIEPLEGSKTLEVLHLAENGWKAISTKGKFLPGAACVFAIAGTFFPHLNSETQSELCYIRDTFNSRIKTLKICGRISDGYAMTLDVLPKKEFIFFIGRDITELMGAIAWEPSTNIDYTFASGSLPLWIPHEKEKVLQSNLRTLRTLTTQEFYGVERFNGMTAIFYYCTAVGGRDTFGICSKNLEFNLSKDHPLVLWGKKNNIRDKMKTMCQDSGLFEKEGPYPSIWLRGDFVSPTFNRNYYRNAEENVYFHTLGAHPFKENILSRPLFEKLLSDNRLRASPIISNSIYLSSQTIGNKFRALFRQLPKIGYRISAPKVNIQDLVNLATFKSSLNGKVEAKGLLLKPSASGFLIEEKGKTFTIQNPEFNLRNNQ